MKVLMILGIAIFGAIGLFTGGCSLLILAADGMNDFIGIQVAGLVIAAVCCVIVWALVKQYRLRADLDDPK